MVTRVQQQAGVSATNRTVTLAFPQTPVGGNTLVAFMGTRGDPFAGGNPVDPTISGSGWSFRGWWGHGLPALPNRRAIALFTKVAGPSEPTSITMTWFAGTAFPVYIGMIQELSGLGEFLNVVRTSTGDTLVNTADFGPAPSGQPVLILFKRADNDPGAVSWVNAGDGFRHFAQVMQAATAYDSVARTTGQASWGGTALTAESLMLTFESAEQQLPYPANRQAVAVSPTQINLTADPVTPASGFNVVYDIRRHLAENDPSPTLIVNGSSTPNHNDTGLTPSTQHWYDWRAREVAQ